ncbi:MAG: futalosine hydrolase [Desulfuromonadales bacterium GWD2_61_12]|nr:MAG: futalosine hydrolase [Desulfuromonadales bacterium GWD2_61_12]HAD04220.1 futalosine hydrolase [Desulfuromonas sp.]
MIAIFSPLPLESDLLRRRLAPCEVRDCAGFDLYLGRLGGTPVGLVHCGVGKANAAAAATALFLAHHPALTLVCGCAGAYAGSGLRPGDIALASEELYGDEGVLTPDGFLDMEAIGFPLVQRGASRYFNRFPCDPSLLDHSRNLLQRFAGDQGRAFACGPFVTVSTCSGTTAAGLELARRTSGICENMEGAAIAQVCARQGTPFLELRGISNLVEDRNLARWELRAGAEIAQEALLALLAAWQLPEVRA